MRVVMSVDIEGASGVVSSREMGYPRGPVDDPRALPEYQDARRWITSDVNAAIEGAARAGQASVISHVIDWPRITEVRVNGMPVSEAHLTIGLPEHFHIPCVLVTGDNVICAEISEWLQGGIETAVVKRSFSRYSARCIVLEKTRALIQEAAYRATERIRGFEQEHFRRPLLLEVGFTDRQVARYVSWMPQVEYDGDRVVSYEAEDFLSLHKTLFAMQALAHLD